MTEDQADNKNNITRVHLLTGLLNAHIDRIEAYRITLQPAQRTGYHFHQGGVVGYVVEGDIIFEIEGQQPTELHKGSAFYEPPDVVIARFDNASDTAPATFIAFYPLSGEQTLITMIHPDK